MVDDKKKCKNKTIFSSFQVEKLSARDKKGLYVIFLSSKASWFLRRQRAWYDIYDSCYVDNVA